MNTKHFDEFIVLSQCSSFNDASKQLGISLSALSKHISQLERSLGAKLVRREVPIVLTSAGRVFFEGIQMLKGNFDDLLLDCQAINEEISGKVRIQAYLYDIDVQRLLLRASDAYVYKYPLIKTFTVDITGTPEFTALEKGDLDVALYLDYGDVETTVKELKALGYGAIPFIRDLSIIALRKDHILAGKDKIYAQDLKDVPVMFYSKGISAESFRNGLKKMFRENGLDLLFSIHDVNSVLEFLMLDPGKAVYYLPTTIFLDILSERPSMTIKELVTDQNGHRFWGFFIYKLDNNNPALLVLLDVLRSQSELSLSNLTEEIQKMRESALKVPLNKNNTKNGE